MALGLLALGFKPGDKVMIIGDNAPQWYHAQLAAQANRGVAVGLFSDLLPPEIQTVAQRCDVKFAVVEGQEQVDKLLQIRPRLPAADKSHLLELQGPGPLQRRHPYRAAGGPETRGNLRQRTSRHLRPECGRR